MVLQNKRLLLGVTGGIAAYKAAILTSKLVQAGAELEVVMTEAAQKFITPLTLQALTHRRIYSDLFHLPPGENIPHIHLADSIDLLVIAPATANTLAKLANGLADNLLTSIALATPAPILVAPAMESDMWHHPATQRNMARLSEWGVQVIGPAEGRLASGAQGAGRLVEPLVILDKIKHLLAQHGDLAGRRIVITAGGTREALDPVRFITNRSSGKMGLAVANAARDRGAEVTLISTVGFEPQAGITQIAVNSASEMRDAVLKFSSGASALIMAAAVADYRPAEEATQKIKKSAGDLSLRLTRNDDILALVGQQRQAQGWPKCVVGFAAETENLLEHASDKLKRKNLDFIIANDVSRTDAGFGVDTNAVTILKRQGEPEDLPLQSKRSIAEAILDRVQMHLMLKP